MRRIIFFVLSVIMFCGSNAGAIQLGNNGFVPGINTITYGYNEPVNAIAYDLWIDTSNHTSITVLYMPGEGADGTTDLLRDRGIYECRGSGTNTGLTLSTDEVRIGTSSIATNSAYIEFPSDAGWDFSTSEFSIQCWIMWDSDSSNTASVIDCEGDVNGWGVQLRSGVSSGLLNDGAMVLEDTTTTFSDDTWYHIAVSRDASGTGRMFVDGVMVDSADLSTEDISDDDDKTLRIGERHTDPDWDWPGWLDEIVIQVGTDAGNGWGDDGFTLPPDTGNRLMKYVGGAWVEVGNDL